jgi:hypothetical protein
MTNNDDQSTSNVSCLTSPALCAGDIHSVSESASNGDLNDTSGNLKDRSINLNDTSGGDTSGNLNDTSGDDTSGDYMSGNLNDMNFDLSESTSNLSGSNVMLSDRVASPESHNSDDILDTNVPDVMEQMSLSSLGGGQKEPQTKPKLTKPNHW